jgi:small subunit ribosomal protein S18
MNGRKSFGGGRGKTSGSSQQGKDGQRRPMFRRRKVCKFCSDKIDDINYKDVKLLMPFVPERAKVLPRRISALVRCTSGSCGRRSCGRASWR